MSLIPASYTVDRGKAYGGMIADTSLYNIDGACAAGVDKIPAGVVVALTATDNVVDGHKVVTNAGIVLNRIVGVTVMSHAYSPEGFYDEGSAINVMTEGRVWVLCAKDMIAADTAFKAVLYVDATNGTVVASTEDGAVKTDFYSTGEHLVVDGFDYDLIKVQVKN